MRRFLLADEPKEFSVEDYQTSIEKMIDSLSQQSGVLSIYQIGSVKSPGISDIDIVVVFDDKASLFQNPVEWLDEKDRYFFIHNLFGASEECFNRISNLDYMLGYKHLWGKDFDRVNSVNNDQELKTQVALEYLVRMFINNVVHSASGLLKIRGLLLQVKALLFDFDFLGVKSGRLLELTHQLVKWREKWFEQRPSNNTLIRWYNEFLSEFEIFLAEVLKEKTFYLIGPSPKRLSRITMLRQSKSLGVKQRGIKIPTWILKQSPLVRKIQNRCWSFEFDIPFESESIPEKLEERFRAFSILREHNLRKIPHFEPMGSSLNAY